MGDLWKDPRNRKAVICCKWVCFGENQSNALRRVLNSKTNDPPCEQHETPGKSQVA